jgi:hypothetical protein
LGTMLTGVNQRITCHGVLCWAIAFRVHQMQAGLQVLSQTLLTVSTHTPAPVQGIGWEQAPKLTCNLLACVYDPPRLSAGATTVWRQYAWWWRSKCVGQAGLSSSGAIMRADRLRRCVSEALPAGAPLQMAELTKLSCCRSDRPSMHKTAAAVPCMPGCVT